MIKSGQLGTVMIQHGNRKIVFAEDLNEGKIDTSILQDKSIVKKTHKCQSCGATNVVTEGTVSSCECCRTPLS